MDWDDIRPKPQATYTLGSPLDTMSVAELEAMVARLKAEIERVEAELGTKRVRAAAAQDLFKG